ncbi:hypothetical protein AB0F81_36450 [Actinoplanes sp. NPDC024001]|uniref:hypothetical protein n=1 Tax=Actinoplanes sp. NPDC024001 TaxID=3154598 RepID=UPI0033FFED5E
MTRSMRAIAGCLGLSGPVSVRDDLVRRAEQHNLNPFDIRPGLGPLTGPVSVALVMRHLEWQWCNEANYRKMPVPVELRSPSREEAQILVDGICRRIGLFMGRSDDELDWHIYPDLDGPVRARLERLGRLRDTLFCEWMVVNRWEDEIFGRQWWSNDMDGILSLRRPPDGRHPNAETASEYWSWEANDQQGTTETVAAVDQRRTNSAIIGGRVYLQGAFVNDKPTDDDEHNHLEIHPLDSVAYAREPGGAVLAARPADPGWPRSTVVWRVGAVSNSGFHRINSCGFVAKERTTVWYLALPAGAALPTLAVTVTEDRPGYWDSIDNVRRNLRRVKSVTVDPPADGQPRGHREFPIDPSDGRHKLRVEITMMAPDDWGGLFLRDFTIRARTLIAPAARSGDGDDLFEGGAGAEPVDQGEDG